MSACSDFLRRRWQTRSMFTWILWPLSCLLGAAVWWRRALYATGLFTRVRLPVPVVVVGNVLLGGVGKTPLVMALIEHLQSQGLKVGAISRGYGRTASEPQEVMEDSSAADVGDEALLMARRCRAPVVVGADRPAAGRLLLARHPETQVIISDDGLQHLALAHDLALCVFDERGLGNGWLFPAGPLREYWPRPHRTLQWALSSANNQSVTGRLPEGPMVFYQRQLSAEAHNALGQRRPLSYWRSHNCHAVAAIAKPEAFFDMLKQRGLRLESTLALPDHDPMLNFSMPSDSTGDWLCTEKDAVKLWATHPQAWAVPLQVQLPTEFMDAFDTALKARLSSSHGH